MPPYEGGSLSRQPRGPGVGSNGSRSRWNASSANAEDYEAMLEQRSKINDIDKKMASGVGSGAGGERGEGGSGGGSGSGSGNGGPASSRSLEERESHQSASGGGSGSEDDAGGEEEGEGGRSNGEPQDAQAGGPMSTDDDAFERGSEGEGSPSDRDRPASPPITSRDDCLACKGKHRAHTCDRRASAARPYSRGKNGDANGFPVDGDRGGGDEDGEGDGGGEQGGEASEEEEEEDYEHARMLECLEISGTERVGERGTGPPPEPPPPPPPPRPPPPPTHLQQANHHHHHCHHHHHHRRPLTIALSLCTGNPRDGMADGLFRYTPFCAHPHPDTMSLSTGDGISRLDGRGGVGVGSVIGGEVVSPRV